MLAPWNKVACAGGAVGMAGEVEGSKDKTGVWRRLVHTAQLDHLGPKAVGS